MKRIGLVIVWVLLAALPGPHRAGAQETVWVSSDNAALQAERSSESTTLKVLPAGTRLEVKEYRNRWYRVSAPGGLTGWIYRGKVSTRPPAGNAAGGDAGSMGSLLSGISGGSGIQADTADTSRSVRGLSPEAATYARETGTPAKYQQALDRVLSMEATDAQINWFLKVEKIGEYAE